MPVFWPTRAQAQVGHDVPYVLLLHVGAMDARILPRLLALYRTMGFRFTTLAEAEADPYHAAAIDLALPGPSPSLAGPPDAHAFRSARRPVFLKRRVFQ